MHLRNIFGQHVFFRVGQTGKNIEHNNIESFEDTAENLKSARELVALGHLEFVTPDGRRLRSYRAWWERRPRLPVPAPDIQARLVVGQPQPQPSRQPVRAAVSARPVPSRIPTRRAPTFPGRPVK